MIKNIFTVSSMTLISRMLGFWRDLLIASTFGSGPATDAFLVAFKIPNFFRRLFAEGAFSQGFIPIFSEYQVTRSPEEIRLLVGRSVGTLGAILLGVTLLGMLSAPFLVGLFAPGFSGQPQFALATDLLRLTFPYLFCISLVALSGAILNSMGHFAVPAITPIFLNLAMIATTLWLSPDLSEPITALALGVLMAGLLQLLFQMPFLWNIHLLPQPQYAWHDPAIQRIFKLMLPAILGSSAAQIGLLADTWIASFLPSGSVTWLYYADRLMEFPLGVFGVALASILLPRLSRERLSDMGRYWQSFAFAVRWALFIGVPSAVGLLLLAGPLVTTCFHYRAFSVGDVEMSTVALIGFALGLPAFILVKIFSAAFYARQDTQTPVKIALVALLCNLALNLLMVGVWWIEKTPFPHAGLALSTSLAGYLNAALLWQRLRREVPLDLRQTTRRFLYQVLILVFLMGAGLWIGTPDLTYWLAWSGHARAGHLSAVILLAAAGYLVIGWGWLRRDLGQRFQSGF